MHFKTVIKMFEGGNVCVCGLKGTGKDLITGNVIARRKRSYVANLDYGGKFIPVDFEKLNCGGNTFHNFINGNVNYYRWDYPMESDVYISDAGIYFPAQYCNELNRHYEGLITYMALSRQVSRNRVHFNAQNLNRVWDKFREQSGTYIRCRKVIYLFGLVIQWITIYDKLQSAIDRVEPCRVRVPLFNKQARMMARTHLDNFFNSHGTVKNAVLIYINKSKHDTFYFEDLLRRGNVYEKNNKKG